MGREMALLCITCTYVVNRALSSTGASAPSPPTRSCREPLALATGERAGFAPRRKEGHVWPCWEAWVGVQMTEGPQVAGWVPLLCGVWSRPLWAPVRGGGLWEQR